MLDFLLWYFIVSSDIKLFGCIYLRFDRYLRILRVAPAPLPPPPQQAKGGGGRLHIINLEFTAKYSGTHEK